MLESGKLGANTRHPACVNIILHVVQNRFAKKLELHKPWLCPSSCAMDYVEVVTDRTPVSAMWGRCVMPAIQHVVKIRSWKSEVPVCIWL